MSGQPLDTPTTTRLPDAGANLGDARAAAYGPGARRSGEAAPPPHQNIATFHIPTDSQHHVQVSFDPATADKPPPHIKVEIQNPSARRTEETPATKPAATIQNDGSIVDHNGKTVVKKDGTVVDSTFLASPSLSSDLTISVANENNAGPSDAQKKVLNHLTHIWGQDIQTAFDGKLETIKTTDGNSIKHVNIDDPNHLVSDEIAEQFGNNIPRDRIASTIPPLEVAPAPPERDIPPERQVSDATTGAARRVNEAFPQGQSGETTAGQTDQYYPQRTAVPNEGAGGDYLNMLSALAQQDATSVRQVGDGYRTGLYATGPRTFCNYVIGFLPPDILEMLGHPPDLSKLAALLKEHPELLDELKKSLKDKGAPDELQADFADPEKAQKFAEFAGKVVTGKGAISADDMKQFMPESFQSKIALDAVNRYKAAGASPSDIALAYQLDKNPKDLSQQERDSDTGKAIASASNRLYHLSYARQGAHPGDEIRWTGDSADPNSVAFRLISEAKRHQNGEATGCVKAHDAVMENVFGFRPSGDAFNNLIDTWNHLKGTGKFKLVHITGDSKETSLQPGDIAGMPWSRKKTAEWNGRNCGHIWIQGFNGEQIAQGTWNIANTRWENYDSSRIFAIRAIKPGENNTSV